MKTRVIALLLLLLIGLPLLAQGTAAQHPNPAARASALRSQLRDLLAPAQITVPADLDTNGAQPAHDLQVGWEAQPAATAQSRTAESNTPAAAQGPRQLAAVRTQRTGRTPRLRSFALTKGQLLAASVDANGNLRGVTVIPDPRFSYVDDFAPDGKVKGQVVEHPQANFLLSVPDDPQVVEIRIFEPKMVGEKTVLNLIATVNPQEVSQ